MAQTDPPRRMFPAVEFFETPSHLKRVVSHFFQLCMVNRNPSG
jgi:hypothetical protein